MALDGAFLHMIQGEIDCLLEGRIDKVYQPSRESVILGFRTKQGARKLLISAAPSSARVHMTQVAVDNPAKPPMFCMLLRKHLTGGRLIAIRQDGLERILFLDFQCTNELGDSVVITLACEIMGRCSNLVVIRQDGTILDCLRRFRIPGAYGTAGYDLRHAPQREAALPAGCGSGCTDPAGYTHAAGKAGKATGGRHGGHFPFAGTGVGVLRLSGQ